MTLNQWNDDIVILELQNEPDFSEDTDAFLVKLQKEDSSCPHAVIDLQNVTNLNSSNLGAMIEIKKSLKTKDRRMIICNISDSIWSTMLATGLDQVFEFIENTPVALASLTFEE
jgi:anti-anti-sigma factor